MHTPITALWAHLLHLLCDRQPGSAMADDAGFSTAELLANAALGVAALVIIWGALSGVGEGVIQQITSALNL